MDMNFVAIIICILILSVFGLMWTTLWIERFRSIKKILICKKSQYRIVLARTTTEKWFGTKIKTHTGVTPVWEVEIFDLSGEPFKFHTLVKPSAPVDRVKKIEQWTFVDFV